MNKILKISAAIGILLLISVYGYLQFREYRSYQNRIHKDADLVFKLNLDGLFKTMSADFISNPAYYLTESKKDSTDHKKEGSSSRGISLPANIFIYTLHSRSAGTYFCLLPVADSLDLKRYLQRVFKLNAFNKTAEGSVTGISADQKLTVMYNAEHLAMAYSFQKENVTDVLHDLLAQKNMMPDSDPKIKVLKDIKGHLSWNVSTYSGSLNFKDGLAEIDSTFPIADLGVPDQGAYRNSFAADANLKVWLNANLRGIIKHKDLNFKDFSLQSDSLLKYWGYTALELRKNITQKDSVITYEYNDDFEKVATKTAKEVTVPHLRLSIGAGNASGLLRYLQEKNIINGSDQLNKQFFPLYQVFTSVQDDALQLSTMEKDSFSAELKSSPYFFFAEADLSSIKKQQQFPLLTSYLGPFTHLKLRATKIDVKNGHLQGQIDFQKKNINAFSQLIK
ncbi:hypothetical protein [Pedobacter caeni]|uniref:Uncharacterized protein n=1 Tax=Pedobacter caeni TaxID=288992 RepID=A0A1M4VRU0_9SPHI|nr:hypothetical protein [Pedobacter caeni]SHE71553.1 hypothetical protein SAMN04488522_101995 [Pedobacter caeni]